MPKQKLNDKLIKKNLAKYENDDASEIKRFVFILLGVVLMIVVVYGVTKVLTKEEVKSSDDVTAGEINYDITSIGTMLNKLDSEYYVMIYDQEDTNAIYYSTLVDNYSTKKSALKVYYCDLGNSLNIKYYAGDSKNSNPLAKDIDDLALKDLTLIKVSKGKIVKYIESVDKIKEELK